MTSPQAEPSAQALSATLADLTVKVTALRGQVSLINKRLDAAGLTSDIDLAARFEQLAQTVTDALDAAAPRGPAAPYWLGLDHDTYTRQLAELRRWADIVLAQQYEGYELRDCWPNHPHAIWELSTLAASGTAPTAAGAPTSAWRWSSTTGGCPAPYAASPTSPADACRTA